LNREICIPALSYANFNLNNSNLNLNNANLNLNNANLNLNNANLNLNIIFRERKQNKKKKK
jgi:hypothetical protein